MMDAVSIDTVSIDTFYKDGLRFTCNRCSKCCTGQPGFVFLSEDDLNALSTHLKMSESAVIKEFCRYVYLSGTGQYGASGSGTVQSGGGKLLTLKDKPNYDCIFWEDGCKVYEARPVQCKTYPFWVKFLESREAWESAAEECPGIGNGELRSVEFINECLSKQCR